MTGRLSASCRLVSVELTGGNRTIHDAGAYSDQLFRIAVVGAIGELHFRTSGTTIGITLFLS